MYELTGQPVTPDADLVTCDGVTPTEATGPPPLPTSHVPMSAMPGGADATLAIRDLLDSWWDRLHLAQRQAVYDIVKASTEVPEVEDVSDEIVEDNIADHPLAEGGTVDLPHVDPPPGFDRLIHEGDTDG
jgi:hypothetical protein